ncbi:MAG: GNAT family N-acetyltransferase [Promethearchaeota archaeon]
MKNNLKDISLRRITRRNYREIIGLRVKPEQRYLIASNAVSMADAHFYRDAWMRAIYLGEKPIGFVMLGDNSLKYRILKPIKPYLYVWRFMIAAEYQGKGYGRRAMEKIIDYVKSEFILKELLIYTLPQNAKAIGFYKHLGFKLTGKKLTVGDLELRLELE